ncbi:MAG: hypothetical protein ACYSXF_06715, partial [Planctomycetota bacterium]
MAVRPRNLRSVRALAAALSVAAMIIAGGGCALGKLVGGMAQNYEYSKLKEVLPKYDGLEDRKVAVLVEADLATLYEYPDLVATVSVNVARQLAKNVPGVRVMPPEYVIDWQYRTPQWNAIPYGEIANLLNTDRLVHVDIFEYRLHPRGNRYEWEGMAMANVGVIERDSIDPDTFVATFDVENQFPPVKGVGRESATRAAIEAGLLKGFVDRTAWLFYLHLEPK